jgi:hypothetical protein
VGTRRLCAPARGGVALLGDALAVSLHVHERFPLGFCPPGTLCVFTSVAPRWVADGPAVNVVVVGFAAAAAIGLYRTSLPAWIGRAWEPGPIGLLALAFVFSVLAFDAIAASASLGAVVAVIATVVLVRAVIRGLRQREALA